MKSSGAIVFLVIAIACIPSIIIGQYTYQSNEFFTAFPRNGLSPYLQVPQLHITTTEDTPVTVAITTNVETKNIVVQPDSATIFNINEDLIITSNTDTGKWVHIKAEDGKMVSAYATSHGISSAGGFSILPLHNYPDYYIPEYIYYAFSTEGDDSSHITQLTGFIILMAGANATMVTITPTQNVTVPADIANEGTPTVVMAGDSYTLTLNPEKTLFLNSLKDLTGSKIVANRSLTVITGHECGVVPPLVDHCDHMVQQIPPTVAWGKEHMSMPFATRTSGALFKLITNSHNANVNMTCHDVSSGTRTVSSIELIADTPSTRIITNDEWCSFVSTHPVLIMQYAFGGNQEGFGGPVMVMLTPIAQYTTLHKVITPSPPLKDSSNNVDQNLIGLFILNNQSSDSITLDTDTDLSDYNWTTIYAGDSILGYGLSIDGVSKTHHQVAGPTNKDVLSSVIVYGFSSDQLGFGYQVNGGLEPISLPWYVSFIESNYTVVENGVHQIPVSSMNSISDNLTLTVQTCTGTPSLDNVMFDNTITFTGDDTLQYITLTAMDDANIEEDETLCLELVAPSNEHSFVYPISRVTIYIRDDERVQLSLTQAKMIDEGENIELTLQLSGYEGDTVGVALDASISLDGNPLNSIPLASFTLYFTKYLSEVRYQVPLQPSLMVTKDTVISIQLPLTQHNITLSISSVQLQPLPVVIQSTSASSSSSSILLPSSSIPPVRVTSTVGSISTSIPRVTTASTISRSTSIPLPVVTNVITHPSSGSGSASNGNSDTVELDRYIVYLIVGLIALLAVFVVCLVSAVGCLFYRIRGRFRVDDEEHLKYLKKGSPQTISSAELLAVNDSSSFDQTPAGVPVTVPTSATNNRFSQADSAVYISSTSLDPSRSNSPDDDNDPNAQSRNGEDSAHITNQIHLKRINDISSASPSHSSMAGSNDNLIRDTVESTV